MTKDEIRSFMNQQTKYRDKQAAKYNQANRHDSLSKAQVKRASKLLLLACMADCLLTQAEAAQMMLDTDYDEERARTLLYNIASMGKAFANLTPEEVYPLD